MLEAIAWSPHQRTPQTLSKTWPLLQTDGLRHGLLASGGGTADRHSGISVETGAPSGNLLQLWRVQVERERIQHPFGLSFSILFLKSWVPTLRWAPHITPQTAAWSRVVHV